MFKDVEKEILEKKYEVLVRVTQFRLLAFVKKTILRIPGAQNANRLRRKISNRVNLFRYKGIIERSGLFDRHYYTETYQDLNGRDPLDHFVLFGGDERRNPSSTFDIRYYCSTFPDLLISYSVNPLIHYINNGYKVDSGADLLEKNALSKNLSEVMSFPEYSKPHISIILLVEQGGIFLKECLRSLQDVKTGTPYEIIAVYDESIERVFNVNDTKNIKVQKCDGNLTYVQKCNLGFQHAQGEHIVFLKDNIKVLKGWLDELYTACISHPNIGAVIPKILYPSGRIKHLGIELFGIGNYGFKGALQYFDKPSLSFFQPTDNITLSAVMVPKVHLENCGGLSEEFISEESASVDITCRLRAKGLSVYCQPLSMVEQFGSVSCGMLSFPQSDSVKLGKRLAALNNLPDEESDISQTRVLEKSKGKLLAIDRMPKPDHDAGSLATYQYLQIFLNLGYQITFIPDDLKWAHKYTTQLQRLGIECLYTPYLSSVYEHLIKHGREYDVVYLYRVHIAGKYINMIRQLCPNAKIIFLVCDLHWLREERQATLQKSTKLLETAKRTKSLELSVIQKSDAVVVHSSTELEILQAEMGNINIHLIPLLFEIPGCKASFYEREGILFIGSYIHQPNVDAVLTFAKEAWPQLRKKIPTLNFYVIGSDITPEIKSLEGNGIRIVGFIDDLSDYFNYCRLSVVPLRYGAGVKGKIGTSMSFGVPVVTTPVGVEGMSVEDDIHVRVEEDGLSFVNAVEELYMNEQLWNRISNAGLDFVNEHYSIESGQKRIVELLKSISRYEKRNSPFSPIN